MSDQDRIRRSADSDLVQLVRQHTPARLFVSRAGSAYSTATQLQLRADHARARDAVWRVLDPVADLRPEFMARWEIVEVRTRAGSKLEFISNPALGRELDGPSAQAVADNSPEASDLQILIGDGLSAEAVRSQIPKLLPVVVQEAQARGWRIGRPFLIRHCRVGVMNQVGELLDARVVVLLIGERPGMSTVDSLSAYMAYRPRYGHSDADRNVISNIHSCGTNVDEAARRIVNLAAEFMRAGRSGTLIKEPPLPDSSRTLSNDR